MKKLLTLALTLVMALSMLTACGTDPVAAELTTFINEQMADVNANYNAITTELSNWETFSEDSQVAESLKNVLLPLVDESIEKINQITLSTTEVSDLKNKIANVMALYKESFTLLLEGTEEGNDDLLTQGSTKLEEGLATLDDYNASLENLATQHSLEIEY